MKKVMKMREVPRRAWYNIAANGTILVRNLHQDRAIYGNVISCSTRHLPHWLNGSIFDRSHLGTITRIGLYV